MGEDEIKEAVNIERDRCARLAKAYANQGEDLEAAIRNGSYVDDQGNVVHGPEGMPRPEGALAAVPKGWYPQTWGFHMANIAWMEALEQGHYSRTDAKWHVERFRTKVANDECARWVEAMKKLGYAGHPGLSVEENLRGFAEKREKEELAILRDIADLAGKWGVAYASFQLDPSPGRRKGLVQIGTDMANALAAYGQFKAEKN